MEKKLYTVGYMVKASDAIYDFRTSELEGRYESEKEARNRAKELSRKCPLPNHLDPDYPIVAMEVVCDNEDNIFWGETYVNGEMVGKTDYEKWVNEAL